MVILFSSILGNLALVLHALANSCSQSLGCDCCCLLPQLLWTVDQLFLKFIWDETALFGGAAAIFGALCYLSCSGTADSDSNKKTAAALVVAVHVSLVAAKLPEHSCRLHHHQAEREMLPPHYMLITAATTAALPSAATTTAAVIASRNLSSNLVAHRLFGRITTTLTLHLQLAACSVLLLKQHSLKACWCCCDHCCYCCCCFLSLLLFQFLAPVLSWYFIRLFTCE